MLVMTMNPGQKMCKLSLCAYVDVDNYTGMETTYLRKGSWNKLEAVGQQELMARNIESHNTLWGDYRLCFVTKLLYRIERWQRRTSTIYTQLYCNCNCR